jgi:hypothetical protein
VTDFFNTLLDRFANEGIERCGVGVSDDAAADTSPYIVFVKIGNRAILAESSVSSIVLTRRQGSGKKFFALGGRRNPLKRLISAKEIQENPSFFL